MRNYQTKSNDGGGADSITATNHGAGEYNSIAVELEGACTSAGLTLAAADGTAEVTTQLAQAMSIYGAGGAAYHIDTGVANAYVLNPVSPRQSPLAYFDGFTVSFEPGNANTGASTVNVAGLGVKSIRNQQGQLLNGGELNGRGYVTMRYYSSSGLFLLISTGRDEISYNSVALLRAGTRTPINGQVVHLHGYYFKGDGGGQTLVWDLSSSATDNGMTVFKGTSIATGRYVSVDYDNLTVRHAGALGNGTTDDTAALISAIAACKAVNRAVRLSSGIYLISSTLTVSGTYALIGDSSATTIILTTTNIPMITVDLSVQSYYSEISGITFIGNVSGTRTSNAGILFTGSADVNCNHNKYKDLVFLGTYYGIRITKSTNPVGNEMMFDWNRFTNINTSNYGANDCVYGIYSDYGSGTGNIYTAMNLVCSGGACIKFAGGNTSNIGDMVFSSIECGGTSTGISLGGSASYRSRVSIMGCQCDAGITTAIELSGAAFSYCKFTNIIYGGATTSSFANNPQSSIIELSTGMYGYNSIGTQSTIFAY